MSNSIFEITQLVHGYENQGVLNIDHLAIKQGEILSIIGPSGAGKARISLATAPADLEEGIRRFSAAVKDWS